MTSQTTYFLNQRLLSLALFNFCNFFAAFQSFEYLQLTELSPKFKVPQSSVQISVKTVQRLQFFPLHCHVSWTKIKGFLPWPMSKSPPIPVLNLIYIRILERTHQQPFYNSPSTRRSSSSLRICVLQPSFCSLSMLYYLLWCFQIRVFTGCITRSRHSTRNENFIVHNL